MRAAEITEDSKKAKAETGISWIAPSICLCFILDLTQSAGTLRLFIFPNSVIIGRSVKSGIAFEICTFVNELNLLFGYIRIINSRRNMSQRYHFVK